MAKVLIVEDDPSMRQLLGFVLRQQGYTNHAVASGEAALACLDDISPLVVLLDIGLAGLLDGFACCQAIKRVNPEIEVILLTGRQDPDSIEHGFAAGASDFIPKPVNASLVVHRVRRLIQARQAAMELRQQHDREQVLSRVIQQVRRSLNLEATLRAAVTEVRNLLQVDRVVIYRLQNVNSIVMEAVSAPQWSIMGQEIVDPCLVSTWQHPYRHGRIKAIANIHEGSIQPCHRELLQSLSVEANLVVPIVHVDELWGLLIAHHCTSERSWPSWEMELLQNIGTQLAIAIHQAELYLQVETFNMSLQSQVAERTATLVKVLSYEGLLKRIIHKVRDSLDEAQILDAVQAELTRALDVSECVTTQHASTTVEPPLLAANSSEYSLLCPLDGSQAILSVPIMIAGEAPEMLGEITLIDRPERQFSDLEISLVQQVASQCAIAVRQARLYEAAQHQVLALERLNKLKDDFLSTVSHELRTPLTTMRMSIQMLELTQREHVFSLKQQEYLHVLRSECQREISLVNDLLELQRLEIEQDCLPLDAIALPQWLTSHMAATNAIREMRQLSLNVVGIENLPPTVLAVSQRWERIVHELLTNACKYTPPGGAIRLELDWHADLLTMTLSNSVPIPEAELSRIFDRFYRIPKSDRWQQGGTGLGLALVKQLVECIDGEISVTSNLDWTTFRLALPALLPVKLEGCLLPPNTAEPV